MRLGKCFTIKDTSEFLRLLFSILFWINLNKDGIFFGIFSRLRKFLVLRFIFDLYIYILILRLSVVKFGRGGILEI